MNTNQTQGRKLLQLTWSHVECGNTYLQSQHCELKQDLRFKGNLDFTGRPCIKLTKWFSQALVQTWFLCRATWHLLIFRSWYLLQTEAYFFKDLFIFAFVGMVGLLACRSMCHMNGVHRRGHQIPQNKSYRLLWTVMWVIANCWAISPDTRQGSSLQNWENISHLYGVGLL